MSTARSAICLSGSPAAPVRRAETGRPLGASCSTRAEGGARMLRPSRHMACSLLIALLAAASLLLGRSGARADLAPGTTLTSADDGATLAGTVGETVLLKLDTTYSWNVSIDNPAMLFRPPVALSVGLQG